MSDTSIDDVTPRFLAKERFQSLIDLLIARDYEVVGPKLEQEAIVYDRITSVDDFPRGWTDWQEPGKYRLSRRDDDAWFGYVVGPHSWKKFLFPLATVMTSDRTEAGWQMRTPEEKPPRYAFLGVRACELAAIAIQDRTFLDGGYVDPIYQARRERAFLVAVNCTQAAGTCFCTSMGTGPRCAAGFDLALTELAEGFVVEVGSQRGAELLNALSADLVSTGMPAIAQESIAALPTESQSIGLASTNQLADAEARRQNADQQITRKLSTQGIRDLLLSNLEHPRWDNVAARCLSCTNCTLVCPTCFCHSVSEVSDLTGEHVERQRRWDSCFTFDFSYMNGGIVRDQTRSRYRQWLTHKLGTWIDQFGTSGCVGCGRCITWCPVGIDLTEEVAAIRDSPGLTAPGRAIKHEALFVIDDPN